jgi:hypothetical protein
MKLPQHIFALTKSEQRVVVLILVALLACAVANHYWEARSHMSTTPSASAESSAPPEPSPVEDELTP